MATPAGLGFAQYGTGPAGLGVVQRGITPLSAALGQAVQLQYADIFEDGSGAAFENVVDWWSSDPSVLEVTPDGIATCLGLGSAYVGCTWDGEAVTQEAFTVSSAVAASISITSDVLSLMVGDVAELTVVGSFTDGSSADVTRQCVWSSSSPAIAVEGGRLTALKASTVKVTATMGSLSASAFVNVGFAASLSAKATPVFRSHNTQVLLNYFDENDVRVRRGRYTIDAQLLNLAAQQMDRSELRVGRELDAMTLHGCPSNIDNGGVYWKQRLPASFDYSIPAHTVSGVRHDDGIEINLRVYDDELPIPARVLPAGSSIPMVNPLLFQLSGAGDASTGSWSAQRTGSMTPAVAGRIHLWVDGVGQNPINIQVRIIGLRSPALPWADSGALSSEKLTLRHLGWSLSKFSWSSIEKVEVLGLPSGVTLKGFVGAFALPMQPDVKRPYTDPMYRDVLFDRYWRCDSGFLSEQYLESDYAGWRLAQSYITAEPLSAAVVEPNTWGMFAASGTKLYYVDRREPLPSNLFVSGLTREPLYGLEVFVDETRSEMVPFVVLNPVAYSGAPAVAKWRYLVKVPDGTTYVLTPDGFFATYSEQAGWRNGIPPALTLPLAKTGTYVFSIQAAGADGSIVWDSTPWPNLGFSPLAEFDLSGLVAEIRGLSFDEYNQLWVWDGSKVIPLQLHYDGYVVDENTQAIYLTDLMDELTVDGYSFHTA